MYSVKEIYYTLQGEGAHSGTPAVFLRFSGCNLWNGLEKDREKAICKFCDTNFWGTDGENGGKYLAEDLADRIAGLWPKGHGNKYVVCTGGEPSLQLDEILINRMKERGFRVAIETNGTLQLPKGIDWICVSPKAHTQLKVVEGNELKLVYPQDGLDPKEFEAYKFEHFYLQPMDSTEKEKHTALVIQYCLDNPQWKLSLQSHKILNIP